MKLFSSVRGQLLIWVLLSCFLVSVGQSTVSFIGNERALTGQINETCQLQADLAADQIETWIDGNFEELETLARTSQIKNMKQEGLAEFLAQVKSEEKDALFVAWPDGTYISQKGLQTVKLNDREYFQRAMAGQANMGEPIISKTTGNVVAPIALPIIKDGKVEGVLAATIKIEKLIDIVNGIKIGETGYAYMIDKKGVFVVYPQKDYILNKKLTDLGEGVQTISEKMTSLERGMGKYRLDGVEKLVAYTPVSSTGWSLAVTVPDSEVKKPLSSILRSTIIVSLATLVLLMLLLWLISGKFSKPIVEMTEMTTRLSQRDLSQKISSDNKTEVGQLMNSLAVMNDSLKSIFKQIFQGSEVLSSMSKKLLVSADETQKTSEQMSASAEEVARAASSQAEDAARTSELAQQVGLAMQNVAENAEKISLESAKFKEIVDKVRLLVESQDLKMKTTVKSTVSVSAAINDLDNKTRKIGEIIQVIDSIANQTNLLALNAAIEAARAGESGRGFAVVAEEVRKLAEETSHATLNISNIIGEVQSHVNNVVEEVKTVERMIAEQGVSLGQNAQAFKDIENGAGNIDDSIQDISASIEELMASTDEMSQAIENISAATQESAAAAQEVTAMSQSQFAGVSRLVNICSELESLANDLKKIVESFKMD